MSDKEPSSREGSMFGHYHLIGLLGRGAMGEVYRAEDTRKHRIVALKLISPEYSGNAMFRERMRREADIAGRLTEPHVVPIHDYGEIDGQFYLDMRLIEGDDLRAVLNRNGPMDAAPAVAIVRQIAAALDAAHRAGVIHRDVKPENIIVTNDDFAYLVDFGIARAVTEAGMTQPGTHVGTYHYMAPERFENGDLTYSLDIYSLAGVLHECLTGSTPFHKETIEQLVVAHLFEPAPRPSAMRPGKVPPALDAVIAKGMAKKPVDRYLTAPELGKAAYDALAAGEQQQAAKIVQDSENATAPRSIVDVRVPNPASRSTPTAHPETVIRRMPSSSDASTMLGPMASGAAAATSTAGGARPLGQPGWSQVPYPSHTGQTNHAGQAGPPSYLSYPGQPGYGNSPGSSIPIPGRQEKSAGGKRGKWMVLSAAALAVLLVAGGLGIYWFTRPPRPSPEPPWNEATGQTVLPFSNLSFPVSPGGVAVDSSGNVHVASQLMQGKVVMLDAGGSEPITEPFVKLYQPHGVAVDSAGTLYVTDFNKGLVKLAAGSNTATVVPLDNVTVPEGVAVDAVGNVYVADRANNRVVKLAAGSNTQTDLPFTGLKNPVGVAVNDAGDVIVADSDNQRVLELAAGTTSQTVLPFTGMTLPWGVAVDGAGTVYVTDHDTNKVLKLTKGSTSPTPLPVTGLNVPLGIAVDSSKNVFIADRGNNRVVRLAAS